MTAVAVGRSRIVGRAITITAIVALMMTWIAGVSPASATAAGSVSGHISVPEGTDPNWWQAIEVRAQGDGYGSGTVDADGNYLVEGLGAGQYVLNFDVSSYENEDGDSVPVNLVSSYFDNVSSSEDAQVITVAAGENTPVADTSLVAGGSISGHLTATGASDPHWRWALVIRAYDASPGIGYGGYRAKVDSSGNYTIDRLRPGQYFLEFWAAEYPDEDGNPVETGLITEYFDNAYDPEDAQLVTVTANETRSGVDVALATEKEEALGDFDAPQPSVPSASTPGETLTADVGTWVPTPTQLTYQWLRDGAPITDAVGATYDVVAGDVGSGLSVAVTGTKAGYNSLTVTSNASTVGSATFTSAPTPIVTGTNSTGSQLTASIGTWTPEPSLVTYQWLRDGAEISGATATEYTTTSDDTGHSVSFRVTAGLDGYATVSRTSTAVVVTPGTFSVVVAPTIVGNRTPGSTLFALVGTFAPTPTNYTYQWYRNGVRVRGGQSPTWLVSAADSGASLSVAVTGSSPGYTPLRKTTGTVQLPRFFTKTPAPTITGTAKVGKTLTAHPGTWSPTATLKYQWYRSGNPVPGATGSTYKITNLDKGKRITVVVRGSKAGYATVYEQSTGKRVPA